MYILNYSCTTAAGARVDDLMTALYSGRDCSQPAEGMGRACYLGQNSSKNLSYRELFATNFALLWRDLHQSLSSDIITELRKSRVGLIFASTKGYLEDYVWSSTTENVRPCDDPFAKIYEDFFGEHQEIPWSFHCNISNACASSHVALEYAQDLFAANRLDYVFVLAGDLIGPFVFKGFTSLKVVSPTTNRPFSGDREGLQLGEATTMILLSRGKKNAESLKIHHVASDTEGSSITRPSMNGDGLLRAMEKLQHAGKIKLDLVVAHGTGTRFNDLAEELALKRFLGPLEKTETPVTNTKWCIGHTLGASGSVDLIAACEILKRQKVFRIQNTQEKDPEFQMNYLTANANIDSNQSLNQILISSLGFGGVHAALVVSRE